MGIAPDLVSIVLANTAILLGTLGIPRGLLAFSDEKQNDLLDGLTVMTGFFLLVLFTYIIPNVSGRIMIMTLVTGFYSLRSALIIKRVIQVKYGLRNQILSGTFYFVAIYALFRSIYTLSIDSVPMDFMSAGAVQGFTFLVLILAHISIFNGLIRLTAQRLEGHLDDAKTKIQTLSGLLPICAGCKKIRDDSGYWNQIEVYISDHSDAEFSHGMCPDCMKVYMPLDEETK